MIIISAVDDRMGMLFNGRRLSRDSAVTDMILKRSEGKRLLIRSFSEKLFEGYDKNTNRIELTKKEFEDAGEEDICFIEDISPGRFADRAKKIILFKWNRKYPGDLFFDIALSDYKMTDAVDFVGSSHERITMEDYIYEED